MTQEEIRFYEVIRPRGKVLYAINRDWKKARYYDPGFHVWQISGSTCSTIEKTGSCIQNVSEEIKTLLK